jgi:small subunit ribosomal protein S17
MATLHLQGQRSLFHGDVSGLRRGNPVHPCRVAPQPVRMAQSLTGKVVSTDMSKTAVVAVDRFPMHPIYKKRIRVTKNFFAHDEEEKCVVGDVVRITPSRPLSKKKRFAVGEIVIKSDL